MRDPPPAPLDSRKRLLPMPTRSVATGTAHQVTMTTVHGHARSQTEVKRNSRPIVPSRCPSLGGGRTHADGRFSCSHGPAIAAFLAGSGFQPSRKADRTRHLARTAKGSHGAPAPPYRLARPLLWSMVTEPNNVSQPGNGPCLTRFNKGRKNGVPRFPYHQASFQEEMKLRPMRHGIDYLKSKSTS
jgi:hypothetical protein